MQTFLYIDTGTGSMLFSVVIGAAATFVFLARALIVKLRFFLSGGKIEKTSKNKIPYVIFLTTNVTGMYSNQSAMNLKNGKSRSPTTPNQKTALRFQKNTNL